MSETHFKSKLKRIKTSFKDHKPVTDPSPTTSIPDAVTTHSARPVDAAAWRWSSDPAGGGGLWALTLKSSLHWDLVPDLPPPSAARATALQSDEQWGCDPSEEVPPFPEPSPPTPRSSGPLTSQQEPSVQTRPEPEPPARQHRGQSQSSKTASPPAPPAKRTSPPAPPAKRTSPPAPPAKRTSPPAPPAKRTSPPAPPAKRTSPPAPPAKRTSPPAPLAKRTSPPAPPAKRTSPPAPPAKRTSPPAPPAPAYRPGPLVHSGRGPAAAGPSGVGEPEAKKSKKQEETFKGRLLTTQVEVSLQEEETETEEVQRGGGGGGGGGGGRGGGGGGGGMQSCPMCLLVFPAGFTQMDCDGHLAQCLSEINMDMTW